MILNLLTNDVDVDTNNERYMIFTGSFLFEYVFEVAQVNILA